MNLLMSQQGQPQTLRDQASRNTFTVYFENKKSRAVLSDFPRKSSKGVYLFIHAAVMTQSLVLAGGVVTDQVV